MKIKTTLINNCFIFFFLLLLGATVFYRSFTVFFAQDDFILITEFSQNNLTTDVKNAIGPPDITHWRPMHNLYFLTTGNMFHKNYFGYHLVIILIHVITGFLIFKIITEIIKRKSASLISSLIYVIHPVHFISIFWISGAATLLGPILFLLSFYTFLKNRINLSLLFFTLSLLASEAMIFASLIFPVYQYLFTKKLDIAFLKKITLILATFLPLRLIFLTPKTTFEAYPVSLSPKIVSALTYYIARIAGFIENATAFPVSILLAIWLLILTGVFIINIKKMFLNFRAILFFASIILIGLLPFIFLPTHLSPHYMNLSVFGFSAIAALIVSKMRLSVMFLAVAVFVITSTLSSAKIQQSHWVVKRSNIAKHYINSIEDTNIPRDSTIVFNDSYISSSFEAYISLGTGKALDFWFRDKNYKYCFTAFESCEDLY